MMIYM